VLLTRDPLSQPVHLSKPAMLRAGTAGAARGLLRRLFMRRGMAAAGAGVMR